MAKNAIEVPESMRREQAIHSALVAATHASARPMWSCAPWPNRPDAGAQIGIYIRKVRNAPTGTDFAT